MEACKELQLVPLLTSGLREPQGRCNQHAELSPSQARHPALPSRGEKCLLYGGMVTLSLLYHVQYLPEAPVCGSRQTTPHPLGGGCC